MTTLGQAYVQIMPSAQGISSSIQNAINPGATAAGKSAGSRIASSIADSMGKAGKTLTKAITVPALGAATAITGLVGALGFKRLVGMDVAQAKLKGLGIEGKQLEIVMENAKDAVTGTTHTMADGADVAAGALAAGVKEGADLERYIKLVGDAATGANAPMGEMAQIFNRVQGTGKLTRHELNQIEHRLPGFSQSMMKHVGADSLEAFYDMVSAGKVGSDEFLDVMDDFAGGMSAAYAETWSGLKDNVLANIGIIGESLLEGLFEDGKKGMAEFLDFLRNSDGLKEWAAETGEKLRETFQKIVEVIKNMIQWWSGLSDGAKKFIGIVAGVAVAIGPILLFASKLITTVMSVIKGFGLLKVAAGIIGSAIGAISAPVWIVIGVITGLIALFVTLYKKNETFRDLVHTVWESIKETIGNVIQAVSDFVMEIWGYLTDWWQENNELIMQTVDTVWNFISGIIQSVMEFLAPFIETYWTMIKTTIMVVWEAIKTAIMIAIDIIMGIIKTVMQVINGDWSGAWQTIKDTLFSIWDRIKGFLSDTVEIIKNNLKEKFEEIKQTIKDKLQEAKQFAIDKFTELKTTAINKIVELVVGVITKFNEIKTAIKTKISEAKNDAIRVVIELVLKVINKFNELKGAVTDAFGNVKTAVSDGINNALDIVTGIKDKFFDAGKNIVNSIADGIKGDIGKVTGAISGVASKVRNFLPFSPPKEGPLMDIMDVKWGETIGGGILKGENAVAKAMDSILDFDLTQKARFNSPSGLGNVGQNDVAQLLSELIEEVRNGQNISLFPNGGTFAKKTGSYISAEGGNRIRRTERGLAK